MRRGPDAAAALERALAAHARAAGLPVEVLDCRSRSWASATFVGERVTMTVRVEGEAEPWLAGLPDAELPLRGWIVADLAVIAAEASHAKLEALVLRSA